MSSRVVDVSYKYQASLFATPGATVISVVADEVEGLIRIRLLNPTTDTLAAIPVELDGVLVRVDGTDTLPKPLTNATPSSLQGRHRPMHQGVGIGHIGTSVGTLGSWVWHRGLRKYLLLSNNHVVAGENGSSPMIPVSFQGINITSGGQSYSGSLHQDTYYYARQTSYVNPPGMRLTSIRKVSSIDGDVSNISQVFFVPGDTVAIGINLGPATLGLNDKFYFSGVEAQVVNIPYAGMYHVRVPEDTQSGYITAFINGEWVGSLIQDRGNLTGASFVYAKLPEIHDVSPRIAAAGDVLTITGLHFGNIKGHLTTVYLGDIVCPIIQWSPRQIRVAVPEGLANTTCSLRVEFFTTPVVQPGIMDGGTFPNDITGYVHDFDRVRFGFTHTGAAFADYNHFSNPKDTGKTDSGLVMPITQELVRKEVPRQIETGHIWVTPKEWLLHDVPVGTKAWKTGRTTGTSPKSLQEPAHEYDVTSTAAWFMEVGPVYEFRHYCEGGDSGSGFYDFQNRLLGLLYARDVLDWEGQDFRYYVCKAQHIAEAYPYLSFSEPQADIDAVITEAEPVTFISPVLFYAGEGEMLTEADRPLLYVVTEADIALEEVAGEKLSGEHVGIIVEPFGPVGADSSSVEKYYTTQITLQAAMVDGITISRTYTTATVLQAKQVGGATIFRTYAEVTTLHAQQIDGTARCSISTTTDIQQVEPYMPPETDINFTLIPYIPPTAGTEINFTLIPLDGQEQPLIIEANVAAISRTRTAGIVRDGNVIHAVAVFRARALGEAKQAARADGAAVAWHRTLVEVGAVEPAKQGRFDGQALMRIRTQADVGQAYKSDSATVVGLRSRGEYKVATREEASAMLRCRTLFWLPPAIYPDYRMRFTTLPAIFRLKTKTLPNAIILNVSTTLPDLMELKPKGAKAS